jgi:tetratricopeptide (TPR) repeat protein
MQFVDGLPLDRAIAELRALASLEADRKSQHAQDTPRETHDVTRSDAGGSFLARSWPDRREYFRAVIRLGIQAAEALEAAHREGIVHRDIKPSNLLVDGEGKLWVTDFGLARCQNDAALTKTGDVVGTRQYMSPEQALGQAALVDHRTDIYSLGATLYELLTLRPAFGGGDSASLVRRIDACEPVRPRRFEPLLPRDLETVVQKAMARGREERYLAAQDLADDLRRVLEGKPTVARPPTPVERSLKFARRHRRLAAAASVLALLAMIGLATSNFLIGREKQKAERDFLRAESYFRQAQETLEAFGSRFAGRLADVPGAEGVRRELLEETQNYYRRFVVEAGNDPTLRSDLAMTYGRLGAVNEHLGLADEALAAHQTAVAMLQELASEQPDNPEHRRRLAVARGNLATALLGKGRAREARRELDAAIALERKLVQGDHETSQYRADLALSFNNLGNLQRETGAAQDAALSFREAIRLGEELVRAAPDDPQALRRLAAAYNNLAALGEGGDAQRAAALYRKAADCQRAAADLRPSDLTYQSALATTLNNLAASQARADGLDAAAATYREAVDLQKELLRIVPLDRGLRRDLAASYNNLGMLHSRLRQFDAADRCFRNALGFQDQLVAERPGDLDAHSRLGGIHNNLGILLEQQGQTAEAEKSYARAVEHQRTAQSGAPELDRYRAFLSKHYYNHGRVLRRLGRRDEAVQTALARKELWRHEAERLFSVAEELALAGEAGAGGDSPQTSGDRCAELAVETLREAVAAGFRLPDDLAARAAFASLRKRPDFAELVPQ